MTPDELKPMIYFQTKSDFGGIFKLVLLSGSLCETKWNLLQINGIIFSVPLKLLVIATLSGSLINNRVCPF